jgi:septal ring factor EnvC (AmiA/AmiB activator)
MIKFLMRSVFLGALSAGALFAFGGTDQVMGWFQDSRQAVTEKINEFQGMSAELRKIESRVGRLDKEIQSLKENAIREDVEVRNLEQEVSDREEALERLRTNLEKANTLIETESDFFRIGGETYSRIEVERDVADKIRLYKVQEETMAHLRQTHMTHRNALALARENVNRGEAVRAELSSKVRLLKAKLERYKAREVYAEAVATDFDAQEFNTAMGETRSLFAKFETKLEVKNRMLDQRKKISNNSQVTGIDYEAPEKAPVDVRSELSRLLGNEVPAPAEGPVAALERR